jgi:hypothetical protein
MQINKDLNDGQGQAGAADRPNIAGLSGRLRHSRMYDTRLNLWRTSKTMTHA